MAFLLTAKTNPHEALAKGDWESALQAFALDGVIDLTRHPSLYFQSDSAFLGAGTALWLLGHRADAANLWLQLVERVKKNQITHSAMCGFQGPLLLWYAGAKLESSDRINLASLCFEKLLSKRANQKHWAASLAKHLLEGESIPPTAAEDPLAWRRNAQARFYEGVRALRCEGAEVALALWKNAPAMSSEFNEIEHYLLVSERSANR